VSLVQIRKGPHASPRDLRRFLPTTREEMAARGWDEIDVLIVNGDAYVDHPAFGGRILVSPREQHQEDGGARAPF
jgi:hypothetical protein